MKKLIILLALIIAATMILNMTSETADRASVDAPVGERSQFRSDGC